MLNFKTTLMLFMVIMIMAMLASLTLDFPVWILLIPVTLFLTAIIYGSSYIDSGFFMPVVCYGTGEADEVAITFDDGPSPLHTSAILDILKKNNVTATFFLIGKNVAPNHELVQRMADEGHLIGNHSFSHQFLFDLLSHDNMVKEIRSTNKAIEKVVRKRIHLFRPPYGVTTPVLAKAVKKAKMISVGWSLRSMDTVAKDPLKLIAKIENNVQAGDVILLHDSAQVTVESIQGIIDSIQKKGLKIVPADKLLHVNAYV